MTDFITSTTFRNPEEYNRRQQENCREQQRRDEIKALYRQQKFDELDAEDGNVDGKIEASVWNKYAQSVGADSRIKNYITVDNARKWFDKQSWCGSFD